MVRAICRVSLASFRRGLTPDAAVHDTWLTFSGGITPKRHSQTKDDHESGLMPAVCNGNTCSLPPSCKWKHLVVNQPLVMYTSAGLVHKSAAGPVIPTREGGTKVCQLTYRLTYRMSTTYEWKKDLLITGTDKTVRAHYLLLHWWHHRLNLSHSDHRGNGVFYAVFEDISTKDWPVKWHK